MRAQKDKSKSMGSFILFALVHLDTWLGGHYATAIIFCNYFKRVIIVKTMILLYYSKTVLCKPER